MKINRDYEPFDEQELIDNLNAAYARRPMSEVSDSKRTSREDATFRSYFAALGEWETKVWEPAYQAVKEAGVQVKFDHIGGRYYARYDQNGRERYAIRVTTSQHFDVMVSAEDENEAKELAMHALYRERKTAKRCNRKARLTNETKTENTSVTVYGVAI